MDFRQFEKKLGDRSKEVSDLVFKHLSEVQESERETRCRQTDHLQGLLDRATDKWMSWRLMAQCAVILVIWLTVAVVGLVWRMP
jgi:hypothetical protein